MPPEMTKRFVMAGVGISFLGGIQHHAKSTSWEAGTSVARARTYDAPPGPCLPPATSLSPRQPLALCDVTLRGPAATKNLMPEAVTSR